MAYSRWGSQQVWSASGRLPILVYLAPSVGEEAVPVEFTVASYDQLLLPWLRQLRTAGGSERVRLLVGDYVECLERRSDVDDPAVIGLVEVIQAPEGPLGQALQILQAKRATFQEHGDLVREPGSALRTLNLVGRVGSLGESAYVAELRSRLRGRLDPRWHIQGGKASLRVGLGRGAGEGVVPAGLSVWLWLAGPERGTATMSLEVVGPAGDDRAALTESLRPGASRAREMEAGWAVGTGTTKVVRCLVQTPGLASREDDAPELVAALGDGLDGLVRFAKWATGLINERLDEGVRTT